MHSDDPHVYLVAPFDEPSIRTCRVPWCGELYNLHRVMDGVVQVGDGDSQWWRDYRVEVAGINPVKA